jgi:hypothetical protein
MFSSSYFFFPIICTVTALRFSHTLYSLKNRWGHCKSMKPAWDQLGDEFAGSSSVLIGDVDCTADGEELCSKFEVSFAYSNMNWAWLEWWETLTQSRLLTCVGSWISHD